MNKKTIDKKEKASQTIFSKKRNGANRLGAKKTEIRGKRTAQKAVS